MVKVVDRKDGRIQIIVPGDGILSEEEADCLAFQINTIINNRVMEKFLKNDPRKVSRMDIIGQNGNDGDHYDKIS